MNKFIQANSPDGGFLQSEEWRKFQESYGQKTFSIVGENFWANIIEHKLKVVGNYFYIPRGPIGTWKIGDIIKLAVENKARWIRVEPADQETLQNIQQNVKHEIVKAPHDMQPKEIFVIDITKPEEQLLAEMKSKTRYNIKLSQKRGISVKVISNFQFPTLPTGRQVSNQTQNPNDQDLKYFNRFVDLLKVTAERNEISAHPEEYYRKMWEILPGEMLKLYVAKYQGKVIAANLVLYYGKFVTYLHGASDNEFREVMAPYLLQWQAISDAKKEGYEKYDFGGISTDFKNKLQGVTKFKLGFSPGTLPIEFPGSYDIIIDSQRYYVYRIFQFIKRLLK